MDSQLKLIEVKIKEYEEHLAQFNYEVSTNGLAHARYMWGEPIKPIEYDDYKAGKYHIPKVVKEEKAGINYDADGVPEFLNANDKFNGYQNPEWLKKYPDKKGW